MSRALHTMTTAAVVAFATILAHAPLPSREAGGAGDALGVRTSSGDLEAIRERGVLRLITRTGPSTYFLYRGEQMGFEYDLAKELASRLGVDLEVIVPPPGTSSLEWLREGRGDLVGASAGAGDVLTGDVRETRPYKRVGRVVLVRDDCDSIHSPEDLVGKKVRVAAGSRHYWLLRGLELRMGGLIDIECVPPLDETASILAGLSDGRADAAVVETDLALLALGGHGNLKIACVLERPKPAGWAMCAESRDLLLAANEFIEDIQGTFFFNHIRRRYYDQGSEYSGFRSAAFAAWQAGRLSRFDRDIRKHAGAFGMDWLLIAAIIYEESGFNPAATSRAGARGLLQIMPRTAVALGLADPYDPDESILAGVRYLTDLYELFGDVPDPEDRLRFALASYNIGVGHVQDARRLATDLGLDPLKWESVTPVLEQLSRREFYRLTNYGYCRGSEAVQYVDEVLRRYEIYGNYVRRHPAPASDVASSGPEILIPNSLSALASITALSVDS